MISQSRLKEVLSYNQDTGVFCRLVSTARRKAAAAGNDRFNQTKNGYYRVMIDGKSYLLHRLVFVYMGEELISNVDHINGDKTDNRWSNLRQASQMENCKNMKLNSKNTSGKMGVVWCKGTGLWIARIRANNKTVWLGRHKSYQSAVDAREKAEADYGFHTNHGAR